MIKPCLKRRSSSVRRFGQLALFAGLLTACNSADSPLPVGDDVEIGADAGDTTGGSDTGIGDASDGSADSDAGDLSDSSDESDVQPAETPFVVVTINAGTTPGLPHDSDDRDETEVYADSTADLVEESYNNSLSWMPAERRLIEWIAETQPAIIGFQEIFYDPWCTEEEIPVYPGLSLICETYAAGAPLQVERLLGPDYQVACGTRKPDTCLGIRRDFGTMDECPGDTACIGGLDGSPPPSGCTGRDRAGRVHVSRPDGRDLVVVVVHGTSGGSVDDTTCRRDIFRQIWEDRGDGTALVGDGRAIVLGDFNTDPVLFAEFDPSALYLAETITSDGSAWRWHSPTDPEGPRSYTLASIDHVVSNAFVGSCVIPGASAGVDAVWPRVYWDHRPVVCSLTFE